MRYLRRGQGGDSCLGGQSQNCLSAQNVGELSVWSTLEDVFKEPAQDHGLVFHYPGIPSGEGQGFTTIRL